jgi:hypothetical protein
METKTAAELVALVVREIREHPEYDHIAGVSVMPRIPQPSHPANWRVELSVSGSWHIPEGHTKSWNDCKPNSISLARMTSTERSVNA